VKDLNGTTEAAEGKHPAITVHHYFGSLIKICI